MAKDITLEEALEVVREAGIKVKHRRDLKPHTFWVEIPVLKQFKMMAKALHLTMSEAITEAMRLFLEAHLPPKK